ncbi:hypothetical protein M3Y96_01128100 [Aphelenchoides besseyi]|nr:hypothetical protein M3Y96_01128100 [Aphelenchoides besseyi]
MVDQLENGVFRFSKAEDHVWKMREWLKLLCALSRVSFPDDDPNSCFVHEDFNPLSRTRLQTEIRPQGKAVNVFLQRAAMLLNSGLGLTDKSASHLCGYAGCLNFKHIVYESLDLNVSRERCPVMRKEACVAQCLCLPRCIPTSEHRYVKCAIHGKTCTVSEETFPPQIDFVPGHIISIAKGIAEFSDDLLRLLSYTLTAFRPGLKLIIQSEEQGTSTEPTNLENSRI